MIERVILKNYRQFEELEFNCNLNRNIFIGDNGAGKSTNRVWSGPIANSNRPAAE